MRICLVAVLEGDVERVVAQAGERRRRRAKVVVAGGLVAAGAASAVRRADSCPTAPPAGRTAPQSVDAPASDSARVARPARTTSSVSTASGAARSRASTTGITAWALGHQGRGELGGRGPRARSSRCALRDLTTIEAKRSWRSRGGASGSRAAGARAAPQPRYRQLGPRPQLVQAAKLCRRRASPVLARAARRGRRGPAGSAAYAVSSAMREARSPGSAAGSGPAAGRRPHAPPGRRGPARRGRGPPSRRRAAGVLVELLRLISATIALCWSSISLAMPASPTLGQVLRVEDSLPFVDRSAPAAAGPLSSDVVRRLSGRRR